ncbi:MAG: hypothetical protein V2I57_11670 [Xanthomonadales bacterium]|jgi:hypothetical protein|nr:hypothetical protein [Xanthomonadales bacterium]
MLYGDYIDLTQEDTPSKAAPQDAVGRIDGHGTGLSRHSGEESRSLPQAPSTGFPARWRVVMTSLSVLGNAIAGAAFLGGLFYAPHLLARVAALL